MGAGFCAHTPFDHIRAEDDVYTMLKVALFLLLILITACSTALSIPPELQATAQQLYDNPVPTPAFVMMASTHISENRPPTECIVIGQESLWEVGFEANTATQELMDSMRFYIDERETPRAELRTSIIPRAYSVLDTERNVIGSYGGSVGFCADLTKLSNGLHLARIWFTTPSKTEYTYSWAFKK